MIINSSIAIFVLNHHVLCSLIIQMELLWRDRGSTLTHKKNTASSERRQRTATATTENVARKFTHTYDEEKSGK